jgi:hypothetical protein
VRGRAKAIVECLGNTVEQREGSFDVLFSRITDFNLAAMSAHEEILGIQSNSEPKSADSLDRISVPTPSLMIPSDAIAKLRSDLEA